ncbi:MAG: ComEA family DNA-binding protein [Candidatus Cloacimonetes bacterium]|nr:ComEA family DNA-binding protein [Candidatus Cloacimonadota bacterium]
MKNIFNNFLTDNEQKILLFLISFALIGLGLQYFRLTAKVESESADSLNFDEDFEIKYDLNYVSKEQLITIPGIGETRATDILAYRDKNGFNSKNDLLNVKGIGTKTLAKIESYFYNLNDQIDSLGLTEPASEGSIIQTGNNKININTADANKLTELKGIGPSKAEKIIEFREQIGGFSSVEQLLEVKGIGAKTLEKIKDQITTGE